MLSFLYTLFRFELACVGADRHRYLLLSVFFQALLMLAFWGCPSLPPYEFSAVGILFFVILIAFQGETWILAGFKGAHFHHLSLMPAAFGWALWMKIGLVSAAIFLFMVINVMPWVVSGCMAVELWSSLALFIPYVIGLHMCVFVLARGHLQGLFAGPLLLIPLEFPVLLMCFTSQALPYKTVGIAVMASTFVLAAGIRKIIQVQLTS